MSYLTLEVEIDHGRVVAKEPGRLPEKAGEWTSAVRGARR